MMSFLKLTRYLAVYLLIMENNNMMLDWKLFAGDRKRKFAIPYYEPSVVKIYLGLNNRPEVDKNRYKQEIYSAETIL